MGDDDILSYQLGNNVAFVSDSATNRDYLGGAGRFIASTDLPGKIGLSVLSLAIIGVMIFYVTTRSNQF
jgi:hypothetical protein